MTDDFVCPPRLLGLPILPSAEVLVSMEDGPLSFVQPKRASRVLLDMIYTHTIHNVPFVYDEEEDAFIPVQGPRPAPPGYHASQMLLAMAKKFIASKDTKLIKDA